MTKAWPGSSPYPGMSINPSRRHHFVQLLLPRPNTSIEDDIEDPHTFMDLFVSNSDPVLRMRSCAYYPKYGIGAFGSFPLLAKKRSGPKDYGLMGLRYGSRNLSFGVTVTPLPKPNGFPKNIWFVSKMGRITTGVQYEPLYDQPHQGRICSCTWPIKHRLPSR
ncbi:hypothetical protein Dimus_016236 [Dionaea muscipula]